MNQLNTIPNGGYHQRNLITTTTMTTSNNNKALVVVPNTSSTTNNPLSSAEKTALLPYRYTYNNYNPLAGINLEDGNLQNQGHIEGAYCCPETREFIFNFVHCLFMSVKCILCGRFIVALLTFIVPDPVMDCLDMSF